MTIKHFVTFYGWPDNDPPGAGIAYPQLHQMAAGTGTYADPVTFASSMDEWKPGTKLYVPYLKRYVIMEDYCQQCITDWASRKYHIDIWVNGQNIASDTVIRCEESLTMDAADVEVNPPPDRPVDSSPLLDAMRCWKP